MKNLIKIVPAQNFAGFVFQKNKIDTTKTIDYDYKPLTPEEEAKIINKFKKTAEIDSVMQRRDLNLELINASKKYELDTIPVDYNYKKISKEEEDKLKKKIK